MKKFAMTGVLALAGALLVPTTAYADHEDGHNGYCDPGDEPSFVTGDGPAAKKDRNGNLWVCISTNPKSGKWRFVDDTLL
jgi:hypothetical protein